MDATNRKEIEREITTYLGLVPSFFKALPDTTLLAEWELFKRSQIEDGPIPAKYRELIGLAVASVSHCRYCAFFHTEMAKLNGATNAELEDAIHYAKSTTGWSTYINGLQTDFEQFKREVTQAVEHVRRMR